jgi:hypothetical protein
MLGITPNCVKSARFDQFRKPQTDRQNSLLVTSDDQVKAYIKKIMSQLNKWMTGGKISKLVVVITSKETGENVERWQFDVKPPSVPRCFFPLEQFFF